LALHKITTFGLSLAVLAASGWLATASAQAPDASPAATPPSSDSTAPASGDTSTPDTSKPAPKPVHHHMHAMHSSIGASKGDAAVEDLNAQSLDAAKAGKNFTPPSTTPTEGKSMESSEKPMAKPMHHHHHMAPKKPADTSAPSDSGSTPPAPGDNATPPAPDSTPK
jgi:hypothetical protein